MKVLVTGANGFLASHIIQQLRQKDIEVVGTVRSLDKVPVIFDQVTYVAANLNSADHWPEAMNGVDAVFHVASPLGGENANDPKLIEEAVSGVEHVFAAAAKSGVRRVIMTSSQAAATPVAQTTGVIDENFWSDPDNPELNAYRLSKLFAEKKAWELAEKYELELTTILPGAIFGQSLTNNRSSNRVLDGIKQSRFVPQITLEVTDVSDLAALHLLALNNRATINQRIIAKNDDLTFEQIAHIYGNKPWLLPNFALKIIARFVPPMRALVPMLGRQYTHSNHKAKKYGWQPKSSEITVRDALK